MPNEQARESCARVCVCVLCVCVSGAEPFYRGVTSITVRFGGKVPVGNRCSLSKNERDRDKLVYITSIGRSAM